GFWSPLRAPQVCPCFLRNPWGFVPAFWAVWGQCWSHPWLCVLSPPWALSLFLGGVWQCQAHPAVCSEPSLGSVPVSGGCLAVPGSPQLCCRRRHRSSSSSSYGSRRKRSRSRGRGKSYRSQRSRSKSRTRRSRQRSYSRSSERSGHRRTPSGSRERRKARDKDKDKAKDKGKGKEKELHGTKAGDSANIKAGLEHLTPAEQAKARLQLVLEAADQATLLDQVKRVKEIEAIESDAFVPQTFRSSKEVKKSAEPPELQQEPVNVGAGATEAAAAEKEPPAASIPTAIKYQDDNSLAHPNLFMEKAEAEEKWFQRLVALRQERLMGSPVA
uniref:Serine/Arginine-related protein 53 n=1 Tax=Serinus canaria TaxID=9135 RepID=A0A8C9N448_SERCA